MGHGNRNGTMVVPDVAAANHSGYRRSCRGGEEHNRRNRLRRSSASSISIPARCTVPSHYGRCVQASLTPMFTRSNNWLSRPKSPSAGTQRVFLNGEESHEAIRQPEISVAASKVSAIAGVRRAMVKKQREMASNGSVVIEGRDIGSVVFPDARVKIFLDAPAFGARGASQSGTARARHDHGSERDGSRYR